jgi:SPP1 gp7 family putative phage head morphogenesis protein
MNEAIRQQTLQNAVQGKFRGHQKLNSKAKPIYPQGIEREFQRVTNAYMRLVNQVVKKHLPEIRKAAAAERDAKRRQDDAGDLMRAVEKAFRAMGEELDRSTVKFGLRQKLEDLATMTRKLSIQEWKREVKATLGIDLLDDYYLGEFYRQQIQTWVEENVGLIKSMPQETLTEMQNIVSQGFKTGKSMTSIVEDIRNTYGIKKSSARLLARDQLGKLNSQLTRQQQTDAGVSEYVWSTSKDSRVRDSHRSLDGKTFKWSDPPVVTPPGKPVRRCHPGEDYQCRCVALPVFDISTIDIPASGPTKGGS